MASSRRPNSYEPRCAQPLFILWLPDQPYEPPTDTSDTFGPFNHCSVATVSTSELCIERTRLRRLAPAARTAPAEQNDEWIDASAIWNSNLKYALALTSQTLSTKAAK